MLRDAGEVWRHEMTRARLMGETAVGLSAGWLLHLPASKPGALIPPHPGRWVLKCSDGAVTVRTASLDYRGRLVWDGGPRGHGENGDASPEMMWRFGYRIVAEFTPEFVAQAAGAKE